MTPENERALRERFKPKVEPTSDAMGPLHDAVEHAIELIDCAYFAVRNSDVVKIEEAGEGVCRALDDGVKLLRDVREALHDMVAWV